MKREPSIHITESNLAKILLELGWAFSDNVAKDILSRAKKYQLSNRKLLANNDKQRKRAENINKSSLEYAMIMAKAIYLVRKELKHRGIEIAKPGTKDFTIIKDITAVAMDWLELYPLSSPQYSFNAYVHAFMRMQGPKAKFNIIALRGKAEQVIQYQKDCDELRNNPLSSSTHRAYKKYCEFIIRQTGEILTDYSSIPEKFKCFMEVSKECLRLRIEPELWITAQFAELEWTKSIPDPTQLIGDKALERLQKYLYKNKIQLKETPTDESMEHRINSFKNLRKIK